MYKWHMEREGKEVMKRVFPHCLIRLKFGWFTSLVSAENDTMCCIEDTVLDRQWHGSRVRVLTGTGPGSHIWYP